jgi:hypothetical protein
VKTSNADIFLSDRVTQINADTSANMTRYTDKDSNTYWIPLTVVVRLYEVARYEAERNGKDFDAHVQALFARSHC